MTPARAEATDTTVVGDPPGEPIAGELVTIDAVVPSAEANKADGRNRIGNTAVQVGVPTALVTIGSWIAQLAGLDLDPGAGVDMPTIVAGSWIAVLTFAMAWAMNRGKLRGEG